MTHDIVIEVNNYALCEGDIGHRSTTAVA